MTETLVLIHTVTPLVAVFEGLAKELLPGVRLKHILDEPLLESIRQRGDLAPEDSARLSGHVAMAEKIGASAVLVTCSTISPLVDEMRKLTSLQVVKIDEAMISRAVQAGRRIGLLATNFTTLEPTRQMLLSQAAVAGREIEVEQVLIEGALEALLGGDGETHDRLVGQAILDLSQRVDAVVLAQASMARVLVTLPESGRTVPVFSSPHLALEHIRQFFEEAV